VNEDDLSERPEYKIRFSGKIGGVQPIAEAHPMHHAPHGQLRRGVGAMDAGHLRAAFGGA
jgi:hypothetical protein